VAARATWKGFLKVTLVNIPIKVFPATESSGSISFNQLHGECQTRIQQKRWCPHCNREVPNSEIVKGYEFEKGHYVVLTEEDLDKVRPESTRVIDLVQFADEASIDPMFVDRAYYLAPDGGVASDAFAVMRDGMAGKVGVGKLALYGREYLVAVKPHGRGIVMYTLHHAAEIRSIEQVDDPWRYRIEQLELAVLLDDGRGLAAGGHEQRVAVRIEAARRGAGRRRPDEGSGEDGGCEEQAIQWNSP